MRLKTNPNLPASLPVELIRYLREIAQQVNGVTEGQLYAHHGALTAVATTGTWDIGDFILNKTPSITGGLKYTVHGWRCVTAGTPGTWAEVRTLTGTGINFSKLLTATAALDFLSIAAGAVGALTITVTGAVAGDSVVLAAPAALEAGLMFSGFVSSADTVTIRVANNTAAAVDPVSATWRATVMGFA